MIVDAPNFDQRLEPFADYVKRTWIGTNVTPPLFPPALWNVRDRTIQNEPRTNNSVGMYCWYIGTQKPLIR